MIGLMIDDWVMIGLMIGLMIDDWIDD